MKTTIVTTIETRWIRKAKQNYKLMTWSDAQLHTTGRASHNNTSWNSTAAENSRLSWPDAHVRQVTHHRTCPLSKNPLWSLSVRDRTPSLGASGHALSSASGRKMDHSHSATLTGCGNCASGPTSGRTWHSTMLYKNYSFCVRLVLQCIV